MVAVLVVSGLVACSSVDEPGGAPPPAPTSVRERLEAGARLLVSAPDSSGSVRAAHWSDGAWQEGDVALSIAHGELTASLAGDALALSQLQIAFAPIELPPSLLGHAATLTDLTILAPASRATVAWTDDDHATATGAFELDLSWSLTVDGTALPLGAPHLSQVPIAIALSGDGETVTATLDASATGELWNWAGLVKLEDLALTVDASSP